jgi:hypothetical protein
LCCPNQGLFVSFNYQPRIPFTIYGDRFRVRHYLLSSVVDLARTIILDSYQTRWKQVSKSHPTSWKSCISGSDATDSYPLKRNCDGLFMAFKNNYRYLAQNFFFAIIEWSGLSKYAIYFPGCFITEVPATSGKLRQKELKSHRIPDQERACR